MTDDRMKTTVRIDPALWLKVRRYALEKGEPVNDFVVRAIETQLAKERNE